MSHLDNHLLILDLARKRSSIECPPNRLLTERSSQRGTGSTKFCRQHSLNFPARQPGDLNIQPCQSLNLTRRQHVRAPLQENTVCQVDPAQLLQGLAQAHPKDLLLHAGAAYQ